MARFSLSAELVKSVAKLLAEIGTTARLIFEEGIARFVTLDPARTAAVVAEAEPTIVADSSEGVAAFDAELFKRIANTLKREEVIFEISEDELRLSAEGDISKTYALPKMPDEPPKLTRESLLERIRGRYSCTAVVTAEFLREAISTIERVTKPDTLVIAIAPNSVRVSAPSSLYKSEVTGLAGSANVQDVECSETSSGFFPIEPVRAFAKYIKGALVKIYLGHEIPLVLDAELAMNAYVTAIISPRTV